MVDISAEGNETNEPKPRAPFALLWLTTLRVAKFGTKMELQDAIVTLTQQDIPHVALIYHAEADRYTLPEIIS